MCVCVCACVCVVATPWILSPKKKEAAEHALTHSMHLRRSRGSFAIAGQSTLDNWDLWMETLEEGAPLELSNVEF